MSRKIGVIVGRFQVPDLHVGHRHLIDLVCAINDVTVVLLGDHGGLPTDRDPLPHDVRREMVQELYPDAQVAVVFDQWNDVVWSRHVDQQLDAFVAEGDSVCLYGSRDSFVPHYVGRHMLQIVDAYDGAPSGTDIRRLVEQGVYRGESAGAQARAALIHQQMVRHPITYSTVDVAVVDYAQERVLLGHKERDGARYRFVGGFSDPTDGSHVDTALRELSEEVSGGEYGQMEFIGSAQIDDRRYRSSKDGVMTNFFAIEYRGGDVVAADDLDGLQWVSFADLRASLIDTHAGLGEMLLQKLAV